jgi:hypothetical protein
MHETSFRLGYEACRGLLERRLEEAAPGRIQLLAGPRQVGKTTLLLAQAARLGERALYAASDAPEAALPGFFERLCARVEERAAAGGSAVLLLDEAHLLPDWAVRLKGIWDRWRRERRPVHIIASGSSSLRLSADSHESLAGRFERLTLTHWSASALQAAFGMSAEEAVEHLIGFGSYPGAFELRGDRARFLAYLRDAILEPALGRDLLALRAVRRPALLRQVFAVAASSPARIVSLQKLQGSLQDRGALETLSHYLALLEEAFLVAALPKHAAGEARRRAAPPKLVTLNNALLAAADGRGPPERRADPARHGAWVENACLAHAWNAGQRVSYWREEPLEVDGVFEGSWGAWAVEIKTRGLQASDLRGVLEFCARHPGFAPLILGEPGSEVVAERAGVRFMDWREYLRTGPRAGA